MMMQSQEEPNLNAKKTQLMTNAQNDTNSASRIPHLKETHEKHLAPMFPRKGSNNSQKETQEAYGKPNYPTQDYQSPKKRGNKRPNT